MPRSAGSCLSAVQADVSMRLLAGWQFEGWLCEAKDVDTGLMWECPLLAPLEWVREAPAARSHSNLQPITESDLSGRLSGDEPVMGSHAASEGTRRELSTHAEGIETSSMAPEAQAVGPIDDRGIDLAQRFGELRTAGAEAQSNRDGASSRQQCQLSYTPLLQLCNTCQPAYDPLPSYTVIAWLLTMHVCTCSRDSGRTLPELMIVIQSAACCIT